MADANVSERKGAEIELNYLGSINNRKYIEEVEKNLYDFFVLKFISNAKHKTKSDPEELLSRLKDEKINLYGEIKKEVKSKVDDIIENRVRKNRHIFLKELSEDEQFEVIEKSQFGADPSDPSTKFANDLHAVIAEKLKLEDYSDLEYYTAVNSHLDFCGVDGFFKLKNKDKNIRVCFDITGDSEFNKNEQRREKIRAGGRPFEAVLLSVDSNKEDYSRKRDRDIVENFANKIITEVKRQV